MIDGEDYHEALVGWFDDGPPELVRLPRGSALAGIVAASPQHARLQWFTGGILRYDQVDGQLLVTDLRLGMTGFHPFRFPLAEQQDGQWQLIEHVERLPASRGDSRQLLTLWERIWHPAERVPLEAWAADLGRR